MRILSIFFDPSTSSTSTVDRVDSSCRSLGNVSSTESSAESCPGVRQLHRVTLWTAPVPGLVQPRPGTGQDYTTRQEITRRETVGNSGTREAETLHQILFETKDAQKPQVKMTLHDAFKFCIDCSSVMPHLCLLKYCMSWLMSWLCQLGHTTHVLPVVKGICQYQILGRIRAFLRAFLQVVATKSGHAERPTKTNCKHLLRHSNSASFWFSRYKKKSRICKPS